MCHHLPRGPSEPQPLAVLVEGTGRYWGLTSLHQWAACIGRLAAGFGGTPAPTPPASTAFARGLFALTQWLRWHRERWLFVCAVNANADSGLPVPALGLGIKCVTPGSN